MSVWLELSNKDHVEYVKKKCTIKMLESCEGGTVKKNKKICIYRIDEKRLYLPFGLWKDIYEDFPNPEYPTFSYECKKYPLEKQVQIVDAAKNLLKKNHCFFGNLPTNFGKTSITNMLVCHLGKKTLVVCARKKVLEQWSEEFENYSNCAVTHLKNINNALSPKNPNFDIIICTPQQLKKLDERFFSTHKIGTVVYDECHLHTIGTLYSFLNFFPEYLIGLTATKDRGDNFDTALELFFKDSIISKDDIKDGSVVYMIESKIEPQIKYRKFKNKKILDYTFMISSLSINDKKNKLVINLVKNILIEKNFLKEWENFLGKDIWDEMTNIAKNVFSKHGKDLCPDYQDIFNAFMMNPTDVRVLILGMDPYINGEANGLAFSVKNGYKITPSLRNIFKELKDDVGVERTNTSLEDWRDQGILLLNTSLTTLKGKTGSHISLWKNVMEKILKKINTLDNLKIVVLWGNHAKKFSSVFSTKIILSSSHPSPLGAHKGDDKFFGSKPFSKISKYFDIKW